MSKKVFYKIYYKKLRNISPCCWLGIYDNEADKAIGYKK